MTEQATGPAILDQLRRAIQSDDVGGVRNLLEHNPDLKSRINDPLGPFDSPLVNSSRSREMLDILLEAGADINARSRWWAGGFGLLDTIDLGLASYAIDRGALVDVHSAARLGLVDRLRALLEADPGLVHARGGDGQTPLHFARTVEIASLLLGHGADIDALDVDHESSPAQYMLGDRVEVARFLVQRGCKTDLLLAVAVGDLDLVRKHLDADPESIRLRVRAEDFPMANHKAGGTIYNWTLGFGTSAYQVAANFGHREVLQLLLDRSPPESRLIAACWLGDAASVRALRGQYPDLIAQLSDTDRQEIAQAARNNDTAALRLMLEAGLPTTARGQHRGTPLHWAAWHGNRPMVEAILGHSPPLEDRENDFKSSPLQWAIHGSKYGWHRDSGDYLGVVEALLAAGAKPPQSHSGTTAVRDVLIRHGVTDQADEARAQNSASSS
jgi:ankyrin repeat protein